MVIVRVNHAGLPRVTVLGDLMHGASSRQSSADVEELVHPGILGEEPDCAAQERPVLPRCHGGAWDYFDQLGGGFPVSCEVVLAAQQVVINPGNVRHSRVEIAP